MVHPVIARMVMPSLQAALASSKAAASDSQYAEQNVHGEESAPRVTKATPPPPHTTQTISYPVGGSTLQLSSVMLTLLPTAAGGKKQEERPRVIVALVRAHVEGDDIHRGTESFVIAAVPFRLGGAGGESDATNVAPQAPKALHAKHGSGSGSSKQAAQSKSAPVTALPTSSFLPVTLSSTMPIDIRVQMERISFSVEVFENSAGQPYRKPDRSNNEKEGNNNNNNEDYVVEVTVSGSVSSMV